MAVHFNGKWGAGNKSKSGLKLLKIGHFDVFFVYF
jgi:hypothetical protein